MTRRLRSFSDPAAREAVQAALKFAVALVLVLSASLAVRTALSKEIARERAYDMVRAAANGFSDRELTVLMDGAGPGALHIAASHDPDAPHWSWKRPAGWARLDIDTPPTLGLGRLSMDEARTINGVMPQSEAAGPPTDPFVLPARSPERSAAVGCLTTAIYYEAALEPRAGQEAVAQVVLNRMRHPGYPRSVCGVVFQGSDRPGCQFSFACDGSMARPPAAWAWKNAKDVAEHALDGHVMKDVGTATHYHTSWVMAAWTSTMVKVGQIGAHLFFRPTGPEGLPEAFSQRYAGGEVLASKVDLIGKASPVAAPGAMFQASIAGSNVAPVSIVLGGRTIVMPPSTLFLGRIHGVIGQPDGAGPRMPTMHAMIAARAAVARQALDAQKAEEAAAAAAEARPATPGAGRPPTVAATG